MLHSGLPSIFPIRLHSGPPRGRGQQLGFLISSGSHFSSGGPSGCGLDDSALPLYPSVPPFHSYPGRFVLGDSLPCGGRIASLACAPTMPASSPLTIGRKMTNHSTRPTFQSAVVRLIYGPLSPYTTEPCARIRHRSYNWVPVTWGLLPNWLDNPEPCAQRIYTSSTLARTGLAWIYRIHTASPILVYSDLPPIPNFPLLLRPGPVPEPAPSFSLSWSPLGSLATLPLILSQSRSLLRAASMAAARVLGPSFRTSSHPCNSDLETWGLLPNWWRSL
ncbi:unnamed protein product [Acanthosepion pharaonis]|uniref:Uncharacterized protein n=1 Tax=Acanthosepion pharaonis TaxID=158019 RepID=A0A812DCX6_ACAPH|nr:unnamed protein product [Sepia pharaonis]